TAPTDAIGLPSTGEKLAWTSSSTAPPQALPVLHAGFTPLIDNRFSTAEMSILSFILCSTFGISSPPSAGNCRGSLPATADRRQPSAYQRYHFSFCFPYICTVLAQIRWEMSKHGI